MATAPRPVSPFRLSSLLRQQKDPLLAFFLFQNPTSDHTHKKPFKRSLLSYDIIINKLGRNKLFDQMEKVLDQLKKETRFTIPEVIFCHVISFYGLARRADDALKTYESIPSFRCTRTIKSFNSLLNSLLECRQYEKMSELFMSTDDYGSPDACTYNIWINLACTRGNMDAAWKVFDEMQSKGITPNVVTFGTLVTGLCKNFQLSDAFKLKDDMVKNFKTMPNVFIYTTLLKKACRSGKLDVAFELKEEMMRNEIKLDAAVYNTLISALIKVGRKDEALEILNEMKENGCERNKATYTTIISGYCQENNFEEAYRILDEMELKACKPNVTSYNVIMNWLCKEGRWSEANDLFQDMPRRGCQPDVVSYRIIFDSFSRHMECKVAAFILDEMIFKGHSPRCSTVIDFVDRLCKEGQMALLFSVVSSLGKGGLLSIVVWETVIPITFEKEKASEAIELLEALMLS